MPSDIEGYEEFFFEQMEKRYAEQREHLDAVAQEFPGLESILQGKSTLHKRYQELYGRYRELQPTLKDSVNPQKFHAKVEEYVSELTPFVHMLEAVSGKSFYYEPERMSGYFAQELDFRLADDVVNLENNLGLGLIGGFLLTPIAPYVGIGMLTSSVATYAAAKKMKKRLYKKAVKHPTLSPDVLFSYLWMTAQLEDWKIGRVYAPDWFRDNREAFERAYLLLDKRDQKYVEYALSKQLGAGILPETDEIELTKYFYTLKGE